MNPTREIFREDPYQQACDAEVLASGPEGVILDQTVFYAEGGGQPGDCGKLVLPDGSSLAVASTQRRADDVIVHMLAPGLEPPPAGTRVNARIDWALRHRHMRMHTCLHLLCSLVPFPVTGGAIARDKGRLDFDMAAGLDKPAVEAALNALIRADHPVDYRFISDEELAVNPALVRTLAVAPPTGRGQVRLVAVGEVDLQPCGGTHVARTGEIGPVLLGKVENKGRQNRRVTVLFAPDA